MLGSLPKPGKAELIGRVDRDWQKDKEVSSFSPRPAQSPPGLSGFCPAQARPMGGLVQPVVCNEPAWAYEFLLGRPVGPPVVPGQKPARWPARLLARPVRG